MPAKVTVHRDKIFMNFNSLKIQKRCQRAWRVGRLCERLLVVTPDLLRKSTPEGLVDNFIGVRLSRTPRERIRMINILLKILTIALIEGNIALLVFAQSPDQPDVTVPRIRVAALPFENSTGERNFEELAANLGDLIAFELSRYQSITHVERDKLRPLLHEMELNKRSFSKAQLEFGKLLGANCILSGGVAFIDAALHISAHVYDVETAQLIASAQTRAPPKDIEQALRSISINLARQLDNKSELKQLPTSTSPIAEYYFVRGLGNFLSDNFGTAIAEFTHAVSLDPRLESARLWLAKSYCASKRFPHGSIELRRYFRDFPQGLRITEARLLESACIEGSVNGSK